MSPDNPLQRYPLNGAVRQPWVMMRWLISLLVCVLAVGCEGGSRASKKEAIHVLFVGNSLTYVGKLPAVFDAVSRTNQRLVESDMIASGGATLTDRVNDGSVAKALVAKKYSYVVLQERGFDFACGFGPEVCVNARKSLEILADLARKHGAIPILLGTYQGDPRSSRAIVEAESLAAKTSGVGYVSISDSLQDLSQTYPEMSWLAADGMHPGPHLTLLDALLLFEHIFKVIPVSSSVPVVPAGIEYKSGDVAKLVDKLW